MFQQIRDDTFQRKPIAEVSFELKASKTTLYFWLCNQGSGFRVLTPERAPMDQAQEINQFRFKNLVGPDKMSFIRMPLTPEMRIRIVPFTYY